MSTARFELDEVMQRLVREHDVLPFMQRRFRPEEVAFQILPDEMGRLLSGSNDYVSPDAGVGPVWLRLEGPEEGAELVCDLAFLRGVRGHQVQTVVVKAIRAKRHRIFPAKLNSRGWSKGLGTPRAYLRL